MFVCLVMNANWRSLFTHLLYFQLHVRLHTPTRASVFSGKLKTHAVKYSETAGTQSETTVGQKNTDRMTSDKDKLYLDVSVSICLTV